jgi:pimeloyl-ACP methyl ester carboxylesterase
MYRFILMKKITCAVILIIFSLKSFDCQALPAGGRKGTDSIYSLESIDLGGVKQTILITGKDRTRPILLFLHGGPAFSEMALVRKYDHDLDAYFIVVNWDQRGTNLSYSPSIPKSSMTMDQIVSDTHELITLLKKRFHREKIFLLGHSFGSAVGMIVASKYPQDLFAYIGVGQVVNMQDNERVSLRFAMQMAQQENNKKAIGELKGILPYPTPKSTLQQLYTSRKWMAYYGGQVYGQHDAQSTLAGVGDGKDPLFDPGKFGQGMDFSMETLWAPFLKIDFPLSIPELKVPVYFLLGKHDYNVPYMLAEDYFKKLKAPSKQLIIFDHSAHVPQFEEPRKFVGVMAGIALIARRPIRVSG